MDAARVRAKPGMDGKEALDLGNDLLERSGLVTARRRLSVDASDSTTTRPCGLLLDALDELREMLFDLVSAETANQRELSGLVLRVEQMDRFHEAIFR